VTPTPPGGSSPDPRNQLPGSGNRGPGFLTGRSWLVLLGMVLLFNVIFYYTQLPQGAQARVSMTYTTFTHQVSKHDVKNASIQGDVVNGDLSKPYKTGGKTYTHYSTTIPPNLTPTLVGLMQKNGVDISATSQTVPAWLSVLGILFQALPFLFLIGLFYMGSRAARQQSQGIFGFGRSNAKLYSEDRPTTTFSEVAGVDTAKEELEEVVHFLKDPSVYHRIGARIPKGVLLVGPPGTGKTLLARAVAGEAGVPFFSISATEFVEMFVGVGASRVRDLFERAKQAAPAIIFVDEIDAIGGRRSSGQFGGSNDEREQTLNQMLVSMDGFEPNEAVIVLAATNRPDNLDPALLRPGRFDREVVVDPPDRKGREEILRIHTRRIPLAPDANLEALARVTPGMSGADLANLANEAALTAARRSETEVTQGDFMLALDRITLGAAGPPLMNEEERHLVAYHEGGHAIVAFLLPNVDPVHRITITPRGRSLGVTQFMPIDDRRNYRRDYLLNRIAVGLGGRAAEEVACDEITSGAQNDLQMVTNLARAMVTQLGMADELGPTYFGGQGDDALNGRSFNPYAPKEYSPETAFKIDQAVEKIIDEAHNRAVAILRENRAALDAVAAALTQEETLERDQFAAIVNAHRPPGRPMLPDPTGPGTPTGEHPAAEEIVVQPLAD
jgi:cell division protease FtsH